MTTIGLLDAERKKASFDVDALTLVLAGSADAHAKKKRMLGIVSGDAVLQRGQASASRTQRHIQSLAKSKRLVELKRKHGWSLEEHIQARRMMGEVLPDDVHYSMFIPNIQSLCSDEQQAHWLPRIESGEVFGCYAQTELSHGSNVRALRTTATYVRETDEIEIDTPDLEATKWWPGGLGLTANHAMVFARLIVDGVDHGVHNFIVQIRDLLTHEPMPGVRLGDIGPKIGYNTVDNGYAAFARVRIPRSNMPCRYTSLTRDGALVRNPGVNPRVSYITMLGNARAVRRGVRAMLVTSAGDILARGCTIAVRYSAVRKQGFAEQGAGFGAAELPVLDYTLQQYRLLPLLCTYAAYCFGALDPSTVYLD